MTGASGPRSFAGPYQLESVLGRGAAGVVYRALSPSGERVALKLLRANLVDEDFRRRFQREGEVRVDHPNVVQILDAGMDRDGTPFIVFELLEGESLDAWLARGPLTPAEVVDVGIQACRGLAAAHAQGIIHRDLKPANLFRCHDGTIKILDFGMALLSTRATRLTYVDAIMGTPAYLAPEQASGEHEPNAQTDLWALGAILYEALSGRLAFGRDTVFATIVAIRMDRVVPLASCAPSVPAGLAAIVERALVKSKAQRWRTAEELRQALQQVSLATTSPGVTFEAPLGNTVAAENRVVVVLRADGVSDPPGFDYAVTRRGGASLWLDGKRAIGLFGGEVWEGDEVVRAVEVGIDVLPLAQTVAIASGYAALSGSDISGEVLRSAEAACAAGLAGVIVDAETASSLRDHFAMTRHTPTLFEVTRRLSAQDQSLDPGRSRPLLGRDVELSQIRRALESVLDDARAVSVFITAPTGMGKSRLCREIEETVARVAPEVVILGSRAEPHRTHSSLSLWRILLENRLRLADEEATAPTDPSDARRAAVRKLAEEALQGDPRVEPCADFMSELLGVPVALSSALQIARRDPQLMMDRLRLAIIDLCDGWCSNAPLALFLEDLQWADDASLELLDDLVTRLSDRPLLVVATARPELEHSRPHLLVGGELVRLELKGLASTDVAVLARSVSQRPLGPELVRAVTQHTAGNPLFVEQIVLALAVEGTAQRDSGAFPLPLTVQAAVQSRLDHLPPPEKQLCKLASILGRAFFADEVEGLGAAGAEALLSELARKDIVVARGRSHVGRGRQYRFKTTLISDVAYLMLADDVKAGLHLRAAAWLVTHPDADREEVATHFERGGDASQAAHHYAEATLAAALRGDSPTVLRCSERALSLGIATEARFALHMARADALRFSGQREEQGRELTLALSLAVEDGQWARGLTERAVWLTRTGKFGEALEIADKAVTAARNAGDREALALALGRQIAGLAYAGRLDDARGAMDEANGLAESLGPELRAHAASWRAQLASALGDLAERGMAFREAATLYTEAGDVRRAAGTECNLADVYNRFGAYTEARDSLDAAVEGCRRVGNRLMEGYALLNLGYCLGMLGKSDEAIAALEETDALAKEMNEARLSVAARVYRARVRLTAGDSAAAVAESEAAAEGAEQAGLPGLRVLALVVAARAWLASERPIQALGRSSLAVSLRDQVGSIEEDEVEVFWVHSQALDANGEADEAAACRARGRERLNELAARIVDPHWRARFLSDVPAHRELLAAP